MNDEQTKIIQEAQDRNILYSFWVDNRGYHNNEANWKILDNWLDENVKPLSRETLQEALEANKHQLAKRTFTAPHQSHVTQESTPTPTHTAPAVEVSTDPDKDLPVEYTRKRILRMEKEEYRGLLRKFGDLAIQTRVNRVQEAQ
jgi:hypothetical protein